MKMMIAVMFVAIVGCALAIGSQAKNLFWLPGMPPNSLPLTLGIAGGIGGSVTMMVYGYWIEQKEWTSTKDLKIVRLDLGIAYTVTALLAFGAMLLASEVLLPQGIKVEGQDGLIQMASMLQHSLGASGQWVFLVGFWGAAFSSLLGVLQGVPYLFADLVCCWRCRGETKLDYRTAAGTTLGRPHQPIPCCQVQELASGTSMHYADSSLKSRLVWSPSPVDLTFHV